MRNLAMYKAAAIDLRIAMKNAKSMDTYTEWYKAWTHAKRRIEQIERKVLKG